MAAVSDAVVVGFAVAVLLGSLASTVFDICGVYRWRLPRRHWGCKATYVDRRTGAVVAEDVGPARFWSRAGAESWAAFTAEYVAEADRRSPHPGRLSVLYEPVPNQPRVVDIYKVDAFWRGDEYVGPEV